jgi:hypothetical protein
MPRYETSPAGSGRSSFWDDSVPEFLLKRALSLVKGVRDLRISDLRVLVVLWDRAGWPRKSDDGHDAFDGRDGRVSNSALARATGYVRRTIQLAKRRLAKLGLVWFERDRKPNRREIPNLYRILVDLPRDLIEKFLARVRGGAPAAAPAEDEVPIEQARDRDDVEELGDAAAEASDEQLAGGADRGGEGASGASTPTEGSAAAAEGLDEEQRELASGVDHDAHEASSASSSAEASAAEEEDDERAEPELPRTRMWRTLKRALAAEYEARLGVPTRIANQHVPEWVPAMDNALLLAERAVSWGRDEAHVAQRLVHHFYESASDHVRKAGFNPLFFLRDMGAHVAWYAGRYARDARLEAPVEPRARSGSTAARGPRCQWGTCDEPSAGAPVDLGRGVIEFRCRGHRDHREIDHETSAGRLLAEPREVPNAGPPCYVCGVRATEEIVFKGSRFKACAPHADELRAIARDRPDRPPCEGCGRTDGDNVLAPVDDGFRWLCAGCAPGLGVHEHGEVHDD